MQDADFENSLFIQLEHFYTYMNDKIGFMFQLSIRRLAAQLCGLFVEVEGGQFESRLASTLPVIEQQLEPGKYKQVAVTPVTNAEHF